MPIVRGATLGKRAELSIPEKKEHFRNIKTYSTAAKGSRITIHAWSHNHEIDFENASVIDKGIDKKNRERYISVNKKIVSPPNY